jgi:beta-lactamase class A
MEKRMRSSGVLRMRLLSVIAACLLACGAGAPLAPRAAPSTGTSAPAAAPPQPSVAANTSPTPALPAGVPDTAAGHQLAWVLASMNKVPTAAEIEPHFSQAFLAQVPLTKLVATADQVVLGAPYTLEKVAPSRESDRSLVALVRSSRGQGFTVHLALQREGGDKIAGLLIRTHVDPKIATSWDEVSETLRTVAPSVGFLAAEIDGKKCVPISSLEPKRPLAIGSTFKLYILDALAKQIASGKRTWDEPVVIEDAHKSLPSGRMRDEPAGKTFTLRHFAEQMISVSDNTAADHLLALAGRTAVESAVKASGHSNPSLLVPFLSTREMFAIKLLASADEQSAYVAADVARKRTLLDGYGKRDPAEMMDHAPSFTTPVRVDSLEWLASPEDLCRIMVDLHEQAAATITAPVGAILSINAGIPDEKKQYSYIGFKGGSEPGVLNMTYLLQRARDDKWLFLSVGFNDTKTAIDEPKAVAAVTTAREFLGR